MHCVQMSELSLMYSSSEREYVFVVVSSVHVCDDNGSDVGWCRYLMEQDLMIAGVLVWTSTLDVSHVMFSYKRNIMLI